MSTGDRSLLLLPCIPVAERCSHVLFCGLTCTLHPDSVHTHGQPPFRESKLTRLLSNAIGGGAKTTLVVCVAPTMTDQFETVNSLDFGQQVCRAGDCDEWT